MTEAEIIQALNEHEAKRHNIVSEKAAEKWCDKNLELIEKLRLERIESRKYARMGAKT